MEGDGRFFDCGEKRDPLGSEPYREVTGSTDPEVLEAMARFKDYLAGKPAPDPR